MDSRSHRPRLARPLKPVPSLTRGTPPVMLQQPYTMKLPSVLVHVTLLVGTLYHAAAAKVTLETSAFRYVISSAATNVAFIDRATGIDYLRTNEPSACALARIQGKEIAATSAKLSMGRLTLRFGDSGLRAVLKVATRPSCVVLTLESISGGTPDALTFLNVPLTLKGLPSEAFGVCALSLNLPTRVDALPALQSALRASAEKQFGLNGAKVAIVAAPMGKMLERLQQTLAAENELPVCKVAGPWARETPFNHGSYLFNFGSLTETNVDDWIEMVHSLGFTQIDNHGGGGFFRFGDMELNRKKWPEGWENYRRIVDKLHAAGIGSIFHTYAFFIDKQSKYVTPVPDPRLDAFRTFTLAEPISADATEVTVNESTAGMRTITGFFEHNSTVLHVGQELISFGAVSQQPPWRFSGLKRGALGTQAAAHDRGAPARHLKECFGLFVPNPESTLFTEIAANHAAVVNHCGFDGLYLDAIDGSSILRGSDSCWYWADKFVVEIQRRLKKPTGMEMSSMGHHFWQYRTRWQAWDYPQRGQKRFIDAHAEEVNGGLLLPLHLGWWNFQGVNPPQIQPSYPDVMEHVGARLIGWDAGISLTGGVDRKALRDTPLFRRAVEILRTCEDARHANVFGEAVKAKLREPGKEFALFKDSSGHPRFRRSASQPHAVSPAEPWTTAWPATNVFAAQPIRFRLEARMTTAPADDTTAVSLTQSAVTNLAAWQQSAAAGVTFQVKAATQLSGGLELVATNAGKVPRTGAWTRLEKKFDPWLNLHAQQGLSVEVEGDGSGALLALRLESPQHLAFGAAADRYIVLDFVGRRQFTLVDTESSRWSDYQWNDGKSSYNLYRETIEFKTVDTFSIWLQNVPPGRETRCIVGPVLAVPLKSVQLRNPKLVVGDATLEFPVELKSGSWLEANGPDDCKVYDSRGEPIGSVTPRGRWPMLQPGPNGLSFACEPGDGPTPRAELTVFCLGEEL